MERRITIMVQLRQAKMEDVITPAGTPQPNTRVWTFPNGDMVDTLLHPGTHIDRLKQAVSQGAVWVEKARERRCEMMDMNECTQCKGSGVVKWESGHKEMCLKCHGIGINKP